MKRLLIVLLLVVPLVSASDLSDYPNFFDYDDLFMVTNKRQTVDHSIAATNLIFTLNERKKVNNVFDDEVKGYKHDFILIGRPSQNSVVKHFFGDLSLSGSEAVIKYLEVDGNHIVLLAAAKENDLVKLSEYVKNGNAMLGNEYRMGEPGEEVIKTKVLLANKCLLEDKQLNVGEVGSLNGKPVYCSSSGLKEQLEEGSSCSFSYECLDNDCIDGLCGSKGLFGRLWNWIVGLFS